jgi:hypothetical protein
VRAPLAAFGFTANIRARGAEAKALQQEAGCKAHWWVLERRPRWMNRFQRILALG